MFKMTRSQCRRASADHPVGCPELGYFDPVTAIAGSAAISGGAQVYAADKQADAIGGAQRDERRRLNRLSPFVNEGTAALAAYRGNVGKAPVYADILAGLETDPGYQFELAQGQQAVEGSAAARGLLRSGRTIKDLVKYAQGLASTRAGDAYSRELGAFQNKQNQLLQLMQGGLAAGGATSSLGDLALAAGQNSANLATGLANTGTNALSNLALARMMQNSGSAMSAPNVVAGPTGPIVNQSTVSWGP
jgi:hypothetical protein